MSGINSGWFYSSLAQTSSSIVGLVGAVLGMHLIQHLGVMRDERRELIDRINAVYKQMKDRSDHWVKFREDLRQGLARSEKEIGAGNSVYQISSRVTWEGFENEARMVDASGWREEAKKDLNLLEEVAQAYSRIEGVVNEREIAGRASRILYAAEKLPHGGKAAHALMADAAVLDRLRSRLSRFRAKLFPRSFIVVLLILAWLSVTGIIWPLSILPGVESRVQAVMLSALGMGVLGLVGYFAFQLRALSKLARIYWTKPR